MSSQLSSKNLGNQFKAAEWIKQGDRLLGDKKFTEAVEAYTQAIQLQPNSAPHHSKLGNALVKQKQFEAAEQCFQKAVKLNPESHLGLYGLAQVAAGQKQWNKAIELYQQLVELKPGFLAAVYQEWGVAQEKIGDIQGGVESYQRAIELEAQQPVWVYETLMKRLVQQGDVARAIAIGQLGVKQYPKQSALQHRLAKLQQAKQVSKNGKAVSNNQPQPKELVSLETYVERAKQLKAQERFQEAIEVYQEAIGQYPEQAFLYRELGIVQEKAGDITGGIESYRKAVATEEQPHWLYCTLGALLIKQNIDIHDSISYLFQAVQLDPENPDVYYWLGEAYLQIGEFEKAAEFFRKAIVLNSGILDIHERLGDALTGESKQYIQAALASYEQARIQRPDKVELYEKALELDSENTSLYIGLGNLFFKDKIFGRALVCYRTTLQLEPGNPEAYLLMAKVMEAQDSLQEAAECCRCALLMNPHEWRYGYELGVIEAKQGHLEKALEYLLQACHLNDSSADLYMAIGSVYFSLEQWNDAMNAYYQAINLGSKQGLPYKRLGDLLSRQGKYQEASSMYKKSVEFGFRESSL